MNPREELERGTQALHMLGVAGYYHLFKLMGNIIDGEEGVLEHRVSQLFARTALRRLGMEVECSGTDKARGLARYAVVCSHASHLDWAVLLGYYPTPLRFIAKKELARVPVIGSYLKLRGILIDRKKGLDAKQAVKRAAEDQQPWPILIFPEGTRSQDGTLQPFKPGGLRLLAGAGRALVPVCITGTFEVFPRSAKYIKHGGRLRMVVGDPVDPADHDTVDQALAEVERRMRAAFDARHEPL